jgi:hypothetical protein
MSIRKLRAGRVSTATAETYVGEYGTIFYDEILGTLRISDGETVGGNPLTLVSEDFNFTFGDFIATTGPDGGASLSSVNENQDVNILSNGTGSINIVGDFHVHAVELGGLDSPSIFNVKADGQIRMLVPGADSAEGAVAIIGSLDGVQQPPINPGVMLHLTGIEPQSGTPIPSRIYNDSLGTFGALVFRRYDNTALDPEAVGADQEIMRISSTAHDGSEIPSTANARIVFRTIDAQTTTNHSGKIELYAVASASTTLTKVMTADVANGVTANITTSSITANASTFNLANTTATTINFGGAADTINIGTAALTLNVGGGSGTVTIAGNLTVNGTTTTVNSTILSVTDKNIELGKVVTPTNTTANGGGITLLAGTDVNKTFNWVISTAAWTSSEHLNLASGKAYYINGTSVLNSTTLGSTVVDSSLTSVGTLTNLSVTNTITGSISGNAGTVTNGVYTNGSYANPSWITSLAASKVGLGSVENTALSTWAGSTNLITTGTLTNLVVAGSMRYDGAQNNATASGFNKTGGTVTANGRTGQLTTNADLLAKNTAGTFTVNNTYITSAKDVVIVNLASGGTANSYAISVTSINSAGSFSITVCNNGTGPLSESLVINFAILKVS